MKKSCIFHYIWICYHVYIFLSLFLFLFLDTLLSQLYRFYVWRKNVSIFMFFESENFLQICLFSANFVCLCRIQNSWLKLIIRLWSWISSAYCIQQFMIKSRLQSWISLACHVWQFMIKSRLWSQISLACHVWQFMIKSRLWSWINLAYCVWCFIFWIAQLYRLCVQHSKQYLHLYMMLRISNRRWSQASHYIDEYVSNLFWALSLYK